MHATLLQSPDEGQPSQRLTRVAASLVGHGAVKGMDAVQLWIHGRFRSTPRRFGIAIYWNGATSRACAAGMGLRCF